MIISTCVISVYSMLFGLFTVYLLFFFSSRRRHTRCALVTGVQTCALPISPIWTTQLRRASGTLQVAIVSQSGALASQLEQFAYQQRVGLTHMISTGNEADVQVADAIEYQIGRAHV